MRKTTSGFTIVELLIVIVVIAILAAVSIVAYNGIQVRAENSKTMDAVSKYSKAIVGYASQYGNYPIDQTYPCLGQHPGTVCGSNGTSCLGTGVTKSKVSFDTEIKKILNSAPQPSRQTMSCGAARMSGAYYQSNADGKNANIFYFLKGNVDCKSFSGADSVSRTQQDETTRCVLNLSTLT